jgi:hypothetical protein
MVYLKYAFLTLLNLAFTGLAMIVAPLVALFTNADGYLPNWLKWFQTFDSPLDAGWRDGYFGTFTAPPVGRQLWWLRTKWLWRNPAYGFCYWILGTPFTPEDWTVETFVKDGNYTKFVAWSKDRKHFCIGYNGPLGSYKFGWKAWNYFQKLDENGKPVWNTTPWGPDWLAPISFSPNPFKAFTYKK